MSPSPVSTVALREDITLLRPESGSDASVLEALEGASIDLGIVVAFGQFLPKRIRELPAEGYLINGHASLLPKYRGAAPIARAIEAGETATGISAMRVEREMDAGAVALERELAIGIDEDTGSLTQRLAALCADVIETAVEQVAKGTVVFTEQDASQATFAPKIEREDARIDWNDDATQIQRQIRAMAPAPGAFTQTGDTLLTIHAGRAEPGKTTGAPGTVQHHGGSLRVATGDGWLVPLRLQRSGGKVLDLADYLRGRPIPNGEQLR